MIVDGRIGFVGSDNQKALQAIWEAVKTPKTAVEIRCSGAPSSLIVRIDKPTADADVTLAIAENGLQSNVTRGENRGRLMAHAGVARHIALIGRAKSSSPFPPNLRLQSEKAGGAKICPAWCSLQDRATRRIRRGRSRYPHAPSTDLPAPSSAGLRTAPLAAAITDGSGGPGRMDQQIALYQKQAAAQPKNLHFQNLLASAYIQKVRESTDFTYLDRASTLVEKVLSSDGGNYEAMRLRSEIELERHAFAQVVEYSEGLTAIAPEDPWNWGTLGDALMELGQYERASRAYQKMLAIRANQASYNRVAYHRFVSGGSKEAIGLMKLAVAAGGIAPENTAWCLVELGNMYFKSGQLEPSEEAYNQALRLFGGYHSANAGLGRVKWAQGKRQEAVDRYKRAHASVPLPEYAAALQALYLQAGKPDEAKKQIELIDIVDRLAQASGEKTNRNLALIYADQGRRLDRALELIQEELKVRQDVYTYDALAWVLYKRKRYEEAQQAMDRALKMGTPEPGFHYHAGMIAAALGRKPEATKHLESALAMNPKFDISQAAIAALELARLRAR